MLLCFHLNDLSMLLCFDLNVFNVYIHVQMLSD